ncbi:MAG: hypothetical protein U0271_45935 [Polyangiaceae bacterium]
MQISGEDLATSGFKFPDGSEVTIADGWELTFDHVFVTVDKVWLSETPDKNPSDESEMGADVAEAVGPWAIDLAKPGSVPGAGGEGTAVPITTITNQNLADGAPFAADQRYAFSYAFGAADSAADALNFSDDDAAVAAYQDAVAGGYTVYYVGRAVFKGTTCTTSDDTYDFTAIPTEVPFAIGFTTPTRYLNCQNQDNQGEPLADEEYQRGIPIVSNQASLAQITLHLDHPFYSAVEHEPTLYFDQFAAQLVGAPADTVLTIDDVSGIDPTALTDAHGAVLPWRRCDGGTLPTGTTRAFMTGTIPVGPGQDPANGFRDYLDFVHYVQSAQGHLNGGEGLCYIARDYPSPP